MSATITPQPITRINDLLGLREVAGGTGVNKAARTVRVIIITEGLGNLRDRNYYSDKAIRSAVKVFEGRQFYIDHPAEDEEKNRPERSVRDLAGYFSDCKLESIRDSESGETLAACSATLHFSESEAGQLAFAQVETALDYQRRYPQSKDVYCGISINGGGLSHPGQIKGMSVNMVTEIQEAFSADIVTKPARGGRFVSMLTEATKQLKVKMEEDASMATATETGTKSSSTSENDDATRQRMLKLGSGLRKLKQGMEDGKLDAKTLLADIGADIEMLADALGAQDEEGAVITAEREAAHMATATGKESDKNDEKDKKDVQSKGKTDAKESDKKDKADAGKDGKKDEQGKTREAGAKDGKGTKESEKKDEKKPKSVVFNEAEGEADENEDHDSGFGMQGGDKEPGDDDADEESEKENDGEAEGETEGEDESAEGETEGEAAEGEEAFGDDQDAGDDKAGDENGNQRMQFKCGKCGETNTVAPPKGYRLVAAEGGGQMATTEAAALKATVERLERMIESKEARFDKTNREKSQLIRENIKLRAQLQAHNRLQEAKRQLKEAKVPPDILRAEDLLAFEPHQWAVHIKAAQRMLQREADLVNAGGARERSGGAGGDGSKGSDAIATFKEAYEPADK